jgi:nitric oxide reductase activation protein
MEGRKMSETTPFYDDESSLSLSESLSADETDAQADEEEAADEADEGADRLVSLNWTWEAARLGLDIDEEGDEGMSSSPCEDKKKSKPHHRQSLSSKSHWGRSVPQPLPELFA